MEMLGTAVFIITFSLLFSITLGVYPRLPPVAIINSFINIPEIAFSLYGISGEFLVNSIINGVFWGIVILMIYCLSRRITKKKIIPPVLVSASTPVLMPAKFLAIKPRHRIRKTYSTFLKPLPKIEKVDQDIEIIEGIGPSYGSRLRNAGVKTMEDLLRLGSTRNERYELADKVGVTPATIFKWVNQADFFRIRGIGMQYSNLLESAGVNTMMDLSRRTPKSLYEKLRETNRKRKLVKRTPPLKIIEGWIQRAKKLEYIVKY